MLFSVFCFDSTTLNDETKITFFLFSWQDLKDFMRKAGEVTYGDAHGKREIEKHR